MKKGILVLAAIFSTISYSQVWFDVGAKGGVGAGFLLNKTFGDDARFSTSVGMNYFFGGKVGINYGDFVGITCDVDYGGYNYGFNQGEVPLLNQTESYRYKISYKAINVAPLFRFTKEASYLEIGPQFSFVRNPMIEDAAFQVFQPAPEDAISSSMTGLIFGFGGHMIGNEIISLMMGLRATYSFTNLTSDSYEDTSFPFTNYPDITTPSKSTPMSVQLVMEINYSLGYIVKASCGKRTAFLTF